MWKDSPRPHAPVSQQAVTGDRLNDPRCPDKARQRRRERGTEDANHDHWWHHIDIGQIPGKTRPTPTTMHQSVSPRHRTLTAIRSVSKSGVRACVRVRSGVRVSVRACVRACGWAQIGVGTTGTSELAQDTSKATHE
jgi:hypothetical protein